jgi:hypothetical protein
MNRLLYTLASIICDQTKGPSKSIISPLLFIFGTLLLWVYSILFIYGLFNYAISNPDYAEPNDRLIVVNEGRGKKRS